MHGQMQQLWEEREALRSENAALRQQVEHLNVGAVWLLRHCGSASLGHAVHVFLPELLSVLGSTAMPNCSNQSIVITASGRTCALR